MVQININGMECTSDGISKQIMKFTDKGMKLKTILLSYVTQTQKKQMLHVLPHMSKLSLILLILCSI